jgi:hypothetical protein
MYTSPAGQAGTHSPLVSSQRSIDQHGRAHCRALDGGDEAAALAVAGSADGEVPPSARGASPDGFEHAPVEASSAAASSRERARVWGGLAMRKRIAPSWRSGQANGCPTGCVVVVGGRLRPARGHVRGTTNEKEHEHEREHQHLGVRAAAGGVALLASMTVSIRGDLPGWPVTWLLAAALATVSGEAAGFPHVVRAGETLAQIAERLYGRVEMEQLLVAANGLDHGGGTAVVAGMRLEVPAVSHYRVSAGETWAGLARDLLGDAERSDVLSMANDSMPWLTPSDGQEIIIPYNLRYVCAQGDSTLTVAYRFMGERDKAYMLDRYNRLKGDPLKRGDVVLVPLVELPLTAEGKAEAANAGALVRAQGGGRARDAQRRTDAELPLLAGEVRNGRFVDAVLRGARLLGSGELAKPQLATIHRQLTEAYAALEATGLAETACGAWREADPTAVLDPIELSPKILRACTGAPAPRPPPSASAAAPPASAPLDGGR